MEIRNHIFTAKLTRNKDHTRILGLQVFCNGINERLFHLGSKKSLVYLRDILTDTLGYMEDTNDN